ncbi:MAG: threonylcarbamoyl-AMP synthase [Paludibacteraceae bacterium]|nr:threonylcarbamoyl-AMP synthase [Paludibacteraceae bacterium]
MSEAKRYERDDLQTALRVLRQGGIILYPTDTIWGIGCDATNEEAVQRIYRLKQRADSKSMLVLLDGAGKLQGYVDEIPETADMLLDATDPNYRDARPEAEQRPLTIIYPGAKNIAPSLIAEDGSIGIRITSEPFTRALCEQLHRPIVSTSANISGQPAAKIFREIADEIKQGVDYVCHFRQDDETPHKPSAIIKVKKDNTFEVIR